MLTNTLFIQSWAFYELQTLWDRPCFFKEFFFFEPQEWPFKLQTWALRAFKPRSLRGWELEGSKLKGISTTKHQGNVLCQDLALFIQLLCKNRVHIELLLFQRLQSPFRYTACDSQRIVFALRVTAQASAESECMILG